MAKQQAATAVFSFSSIAQELFEMTVVVYNHATVGVQLRIIHN